ncbi:aromatic prenyltransferase [Aspergillus floccosus]
MDLNGSDVALKLYPTPMLKSVVTGAAPLTLAYDALHALGSPHIEALPWIEKFVAPAKTRFKFYFAQTVATFARMTQIWTLNGQMSGADTDRGSELLRELWDAFNIPEGQHESLSLDRVRTTAPATAYPLLFNLEIHPSNAPLQVKIYFPVAGIKDALVADALDGLFAKHGFCKPATMYKKTYDQHRAKPPRKHPSADVGVVCVFGDEGGCSDGLLPLATGQCLTR